ncbi:Wadjet anti-phage system protein JetD domain-containing protein [Bacillus sp. 2205SS5-2]|uniref:Wadjet anti-phage system protein JetD domain-containing protein n=1 Tax=Bacillus sp. 2205SS5-2 TaxID=3109031 RepID=UPI0030059B03
MRGFVSQELLKFSKKTIAIEELEKLLANRGLSYQDFANLILSFEEEGILEMVKAKGRNIRTPSLAYSYRIQKQRLKREYHEELIKCRLTLHPSIHLDVYFGLDPLQWKNDLPYLLRIHQFLESFGFPEYEVPAPERSVELVGDEKWITEEKGKELLERVELWSAMKIIPVSDPLMMAVNPAVLANEKQNHLIVENKTTFQALVDALPETEFSSLIYGSGNKIIKSIEQFPRQLPVLHADHRYYYFGDIDRSGIFIWHRLNEKVRVQLAMPFYQACMDKSPLEGKTYQRIDYTSIEAFLGHFSTDEKDRLQSVLDRGQYYPQEVLRTRELQDIWRQSVWN